MNKLRLAAWCRMAIIAIATPLLITGCVTPPFVKVNEPTKFVVTLPKALPKDAPAKLQVSVGYISGHPIKNALAYGSLDRSKFTLAPCPLVINGGEKEGTVTLTFKDPDYAGQHFIMLFEQFPGEDRGFFGATTFMLEPDGEVHRVQISKGPRTSVTPIGPNRR